MKEILGLDSALDAAKEAGLNNMMISAPLIIEMGDRIKEIDNLIDVLVCITHHDGALDMYRDRWLPIVQEELRRRGGITTAAMY